LVPSGRRRINIEGRAHKVIPQIARAERLNPDQLRDIYITGPDNQFVPLSTIATIHDSMVPRSLNRFQQLNAIKLSGTTTQLDEGRKVLENAAWQHSRTTLVPRRSSATAVTRSGSEPSGKNIVDG
jgi:multidrug efflux pump subunit AcrB